MGVAVFLLLQALLTGVDPSLEDQVLVVAGVDAFGLAAAGVPSSSSLDSPKGERWVFREGFGVGFARGLLQDIEEWLWRNCSC